MTGSKAQKALLAARKRALCEYVGKPPTYDVDANVVEVLKIIDREYRTREWTPPDGANVSIKKRGDGICFIPSKKTADPPTHEDGTATEEDAIKHLRPFLGKKISQVGFRYFGDDKQKEAELKKFLEDNEDVLFGRLLGYGGDACSRGLRVFTRVCKLTNKADGRKCLDVPEELLNVFYDKQKVPVMVPKYCYDIKNPKNPETKTAVVEGSLFFNLCSVRYGDPKRREAMFVEQQCHLMEETHEVAMAQPFRERTLRPPEEYAICTQGSTQLAGFDRRSKLEPEDKIECWVAIHGAKYFRAPTEEEHAAFVACKDRDNQTKADKKKRRAMEAGAPSKPKKQKSMKDFFGALA